MRAANEQTTYDTIVTQERAAMERWYTGDPSGYVELFVDDLTYFAPVSGGRLESVSALKELFAPIEGMIKVPRFEMFKPKLQLHGDVAVFTYQLNEYASGGSASARWNVTHVYRRTDKQWRIMHAHWSAMAPAQ
jgi:hypothetical protein